MDNFDIHSSLVRARQEVVDIFHGILEEVDISDDINEIQDSAALLNEVDKVYRHLEILRSAWAAGTVDTLNAI